MTDIDDFDDLDLPEEDDIASTGAAADSAETDEKLKQLPRILRYAVLAKYGAEHLRERLVAEISEVAPGVPQTLAWAESHDAAIGLALAAALDHLAVTQDKSDLRSLADCVRLLTLPVPGAAAHDAHHRRVAKALLQAVSHLPTSDMDLKLAATLEAIGLGWAVLPAHMDPLTRLRGGLAVVEAYQVGRQMAKRRVALTEAELREEFDEKIQALKNEPAGKTAEQAESAVEPAVDVPEDHVVVCTMADADMKGHRMRELITPPLKSAINVALPLVPVPPL